MIVYKFCTGKEVAQLNHCLSNEEIYSVLEREIVTLKLKPGETLSENQLCERFSVSRTPIRSVLQRLQQNRFVQIIPYKGTFVTPIDYSVMNQLIYQRVAVETMVLRDFVLQCNPPVAEHVRYKLEQMNQEAKKLTDGTNSFDIDRFLQLDFAMHEVWFRETDKLCLWNAFSLPQADYTRFCMLDIVEANNVPDVLSEHMQMMDIIDRKIPITAIEQLMQQHLYGGVRRLGSQIYTELWSYFAPLE